jgi:hypothetical protein
MQDFRVKTYSVKITNCATPYAYIMLYDAESADNAQYKARLNFSQMQEVNSYSLTEDGTFINVDLNFKVFDSTIDILRNEEPITFTWWARTQVCMICTDEEPVGEGEIKFFPSVLMPSP